MGHFGPLLNSNFAPQLVGQEYRMVIFWGQRQIYSLVALWMNSNIFQNFTQGFRLVHLLFIVSVWWIDIAAAIFDTDGIQTSPEIQRGRVINSITYKMDFST